MGDTNHLMLSFVLFAAGVGVLITYGNDSPVGVKQFILLRYPTNYDTLSNTT